MTAVDGAVLVRTRVSLEHARPMLNAACWRTAAEGVTVVVAGPDFEAFTTVTVERGLLRTVELAVVDLTAEERGWAEWLGECIDAQATDGGAR